jgi:hypothetical protein
MNDVELEWFKLEHGWALTVNLSREALDGLARDGASSRLLEAEEGGDFPHVAELAMNIVSEN